MVSFKIIFIINLHSNELIYFIPWFTLEAISKIGFWFKISRQRMAGQERRVEVQPAPPVDGIFDWRVGHQASPCGLCPDKKDFYEMASNHFSPFH
jgi:hypothetical protein